MSNDYENKRLDWRASERVYECDENKIKERKEKVEGWAEREKEDDVCHVQKYEVCNHNCKGPRESSQYDTQHDCYMHGDSKIMQSHTVVFNIIINFRYKKGNLYTV